MLAFQLLVVIVALIGGIWPALFAAVLSGLTLDFLFVAPAVHGRRSPTRCTSGLCSSTS